MKRTIVLLIISSALAATVFGTAVAGTPKIKIGGVCPSGTKFYAKAPSSKPPSWSAAKPCCDAGQNTEGLLVLCVAKAPLLPATKSN